MKNHRLIRKYTLLAALIGGILIGNSAITGKAYAQMKSHDHVHQFVVGTVTKIMGEMVYLDTQPGTRSLAMKEFENERISRVHKGDRFLMEMEEGNQVIDIDRIIGPENETHPEGHRTVNGKLVEFDRKYQIITLELTDESETLYKLKEAAATKINHVEMGTHVEIEIDEENGFVNDFLLLN